MKNRLGTITVSLLLVAAAPALAAPATVNLRVEGAARTLYENPVTTDGHAVTTTQGGSHMCDGLNGGANPTSGPTMTSALDDGAKSAGFDFDGPYDSGYDDFFLTRIGPDTNTGAPNYQPYWYSFRNWADPQKGGCQQQVQPGDDVLWAFVSFGQPLLELTGAPTRAAVGESFGVLVRQHDGNGNAVNAAGADVAGTSTGVDGRATISFDSAGTKRFKATRADAIRSNAAEVCVYVPDSGECGTAKPGVEPPPPAAPAVKDTEAPAVTLSLRDGGTYRRGPRVLAGSADDAGGLWGVYLRLSKVESGATAGRCRWFSGRLERFTRSRPCAKARFIRLGREAKWSYLLPERLKRGSYVVEAKALDRNLNRGAARAAFRVR